MKKSILLKAIVIIIPIVCGILAQHIENQRSKENHEDFVRKYTSYIDNSQTIEAARYN